MKEMLLEKLQGMYKEFDEVYKGIGEMSIEEIEKFVFEAYEDDEYFEGTFEEYLRMVIDVFGNF